VNLASDLPRLEAGAVVSGTAVQLAGVYRVTVPANGWLLSTLTGDSEEPGIIVTGADGRGSSRDSVFVDEGFARLGPIAPAQNSDYVLVASTVGDYTLTLDWVIPAEVPIGGSAAGNLDEVAQALYFSFEADFGDVLDIQADSGNQLNTRMAIINPYGNEEARVNDGDGIDPWLLQFAVDYTGRFLVIVEPQNSGAVLTGAVTLRVQRAVLTSLDGGPVVVTLGGEQTERYLAFEGRTGEVVRLEVSRRDPESGGPLPEIVVSQFGEELVEVESISGLRAIRLEFEVGDRGVVQVMLRSYGEIQVQVTLTPVG
jgi:hypothetical protein